MGSVYVWLCALFISIGGFMFGYETRNSALPQSSINGVKEMRGFRETFNISFNQEALGGLNMSDSGQCGSEDDVETSALLGIIVSIFSVGAFVGTILSGLLSDSVGRKVTVIIGASTCAVGGAFQVSSFYLWMLFPGRIINGIGCGILLQACPLYIAEIAPKSQRGAMILVLVSFTLIASVAGNVINLINKRFIFGWRVSFSVSILFSIILIIGSIFVPETPRFLLKRHKDARALKVLRKIYAVNNKAQDELESIKLSLRRSANNADCLQKLRYFFNFSILQRVFIGFMLMLLARTAGPPVIIYYSVAIFCKLGIDGFIGSIVLFIFMLIVQIIGIFLVDKCGRKSLLLVGAIILGLSLIASATLIQIFDLENTTDLSLGRRIAGYVVIALICFMMGINNISFASVVWVVVNEIYPLRIRGISAALGQLGWWGGTFLMGEMGPVLLSSPLRTAGTFYFFSGMVLLAFLHVLLLLPETKGRSLEDIENLFNEPWLRRTEVLYYLRYGYLCCFSRRRQVQIETPDSVLEEKENLEEPHDQISLSSIDSVEPNEEYRTEDSKL